MRQCRTQVISSARDIHARAVAYAIRANDHVRTSKHEELTPPHGAFQGAVLGRGGKNWVTSVAMAKRNERRGCTRWT